MGSGVGREKKNLEQQENMTRNKIFLDEGVGIEASQISRKWTSKPSILRNMDSINQDNLSPKVRKASQFQKKQLESDEDESVIYSSEEEFSNSSMEMRYDEGYRKIREEDFNKKNETAEFGKKDSTSPTKKLDSNQSESDIEQSSDDEQKRKIITQHQFNWAKLSDDDSAQDDQDENVRKIKQAIQKLKDDDSIDSFDSTADLNLIESLDLDDLLKIGSTQHQQTQNKFRIKRLYLRSRLGNDKAIIGQEKKIKFDAKQEEFFEIYEQQEVEEVSGGDDQDIVSQKQEQIKQKEFTPQDFLEEIGIAVTCKKGNKKDGPHMNDYFIYNDQFTKMIGLIDGHGEYGHLVSNIAYRLLFNHLVNLPIFYTDPKKALQRVLYRLQNYVKQYFDKKKNFEQANCILSGCVVTVIIQRENRLIIGHIGDNKATIYKELHNSNKQKKIVVELTPIHCPLDANEKQRIFTSGGEVRKNGQMDEHIYVRGRLYPQLHVTRSIGDLIAHVIGVTSLPFMKEYDLTQFDTFLVMSTSPAFMYMEQEEIMNHLTGFTLRNIRQACDSLYKRAKSSWIVSEGVFEDMTIIMLWLGPYKDKK